ncbi:MAG: hypothetical protein FWC70_07670 [Defluviitaleaceae bacterium]|nr:hypothetical protein [Defluviitaleaceae bacterium]
MNFYNVNSCNYRKLQSCFHGHEEIESRYEPQFPLSAEREYKRLARDLQQDFNNFIEPYIIASVVAVHALQPTPDAPQYSPPVYLGRRINTITSQLTRHTIRQWEKSVKKTLGFDINRDYYNGMVSMRMQDWAREQREQILSRIEEKISDIVRILTVESKGITETVTSAVEKSQQVQTSISQLALTNIGAVYAACTKQFNLDAGNSKYRWKIRPSASKTGTRFDHALLADGIFYYNDPPVVNQSSGKTANPGEDYNCHCIDKWLFQNPFLAGGLLAGAALGYLTAR